MKGLAILSLTLGAAASPSPNRGDFGLMPAGGMSVITGAVMGCSAKAKACDAAVAGIKATADLKAAVLALKDLDATLTTTVATIKAAGALSVADIATLQIAVSAFGVASGGLNANLVAKQGIVAQLGFCGPFSEGFLKVYTSAGLLTDALAGLAGKAKVAAGNFSAGVDLPAYASCIENVGADFAVGLDAFGAGKCVDVGTGAGAGGSGSGVNDGDEEGSNEDDDDDSSDETSDDDDRSDEISDDDIAVSSADWSTTTAVTPVGYQTPATMLKSVVVAVPTTTAAPSASGSIIGGSRSGWSPAITSAVVARPTNGTTATASPTLVVVAGSSVMKPMTAVFSLATFACALFVYAL